MYVLNNTKFWNFVYGLNNLFNLDRLQQDLLNKKKVFPIYNTQNRQAMLFNKRESFFM